MKMIMEGPTLHLCHSQYATLTPVYRLRFLFLILTISISFLAPSSRACTDSEPLECANRNFTYPFGARNSGCGDPALQLECDRKVNLPLINISGYQYYILELWEKDYMMRIIDKNMLGHKCNPSFSNNTREMWSRNQFHITDEYKNITLWEECKSSTDTNDDIKRLPCNDTWYLSSVEDSILHSMCKLQVTLPVEKGPQIPDIPDSIQRGFAIKWNLSESCVDCASGGGFCMYDKTNSAQFHCERPKNKPPLTAIFLGVSVTGPLLLLGALILFVIRKRCLPTSSEKAVLSNVEKFLQDYVHQMPCRYSYSQLMKITNNFVHRVGEGGFGVVYKGKLSTGDLVAVKMLDQSRRCENQFMNEVATIGRIHHVHLVRLMGYCYEEHRNALVYEYMANGSLDNFIFAGREKEQILNWVELYSIALGAARGIAYLHQDCDNRIIHFDIKPHNILLDEEFRPKVADFGLAKLCGKKEDHISMTGARGTPGYAAPEVWNRNMGAVTDKSDVYSFGMVLLEIVGGRKNIDVQVSRSSQLYFPEWAFKSMENGQLERGLRGSGQAEIECEEKEKAIRLAKIGLWCIQYNSRDRPSMSRVVQMLEGNGDDVTNPPVPLNSTVRVAPSIHSSEESSV